MRSTTGLGDYAGRYRRGENRAQVFADLVSESIAGFGSTPVTALDIGCGHGLCGNADLQRQIASKVARFLGVEPDVSQGKAEYFSEVYQTVLEQAPIPPGSVHVAYASFVLEHIADPTKFLDCLQQILVPGGVFLGFTVDGRHPFSQVSTLLEKLRLKDWYLDSVRGKRGVDRYENYETFYRINSPRQFRRHAGNFQHIECESLHRVGQLDYYFPRFLKPLLHLADRCWMGLHLPGSMLLVRLTK